jgi:presenilin-like A22 family membrane protease
MKHNLLTTMKLLVGTAIAIAVGLLLVPVMGTTVVPGMMSGWQMAVVIAAAIAIGTLLWFAILKFAKGYTLAFFAAAIALLWSDLARAIWKDVLTIIGVFLVMYAGYYLCVQVMQESWVQTRRWMWLSNYFVVGAIAIAGASFANRLAPWMAIVLLGVVAVYDAIAVWKTKHMQAFAKLFMAQKIIPGLGIPKEKEDSWALLGGGDIFFIVLTAGTFVKTSIGAVWISAACMFAALVVLFAISRKKRFYPAIPFIFAGQVVALLLLLCGVGI